jgi:hypothetical protein
MARTKVSIKQDSEKPIAVELLAQSIADIAEGMRQVSASRLTRAALITLIHERSKVARRNIELVLNNLDQLEQIWLKPKRN